MMKNCQKRLLLVSHTPLLKTTHPHVVHDVALSFTQRFDPTHGIQGVAPIMYDP